MLPLNTIRFILPRSCTPRRPIYILGTELADICVGHLPYSLQLPVSGKSYWANLDAIGDSFVDQVTIFTPAGWLGACRHEICARPMTVTLSAAIVTGAPQEPSCAGTGIMPSSRPSSSTPEMIIMQPLNIFMSNGNCTTSPLTNASAGLSRQASQSRNAALAISRAQPSVSFHAVHCSSSIAGSLLVTTLSRNFMCASWLCAIIVRASSADSAICSRRRLSSSTDLTSVSIHFLGRTAPVVCGFSWRKADFGVENAFT